MSVHNHEHCHPGHHHNLNNNNNNNDIVNYQENTGANIIDDETTSNMVDITALIFDCATNHLNVHDPFMSNNHSINPSGSSCCITNIVHGQSTTTTTTTNPTLLHQQPPPPPQHTLDDRDLFNLQDAMAATQLLDPIMDGCQIPISSYYHTLSDTTATTATTSATGTNERMLYPRPIPTGLHRDPNHSLLWDDLTILDTTIICIETLTRFQSFLSGSAVNESTFTCLYAHAAVLADMQSRLVPNLPVDHHSRIHHQHHHHNETFLSSTAVPSAATTILEELMEHATLDDPPVPKVKSTATNKTNHETEEESRLLPALQWSVFACTYAMLDLTEMIREIIFNADIYEEEDFVVPTHNIPFYPSMIASQQESDVSATTITSDHNSERSFNDNNGSSDNHHNDMMDSNNILKIAIQYINELTTSAPQKGTENESDENDNNYHCLHIIGDILRYEFHMIQILPILARLHSGPDLYDTLVSIQTILQTAIQRLNQIYTNITKVILLDDTTNHSEESNNNDTDHNIYNRPSMQRTIQRCFDAYVLRPYVGNIPLRKIKHVSPPQSIHTLRTITTELDTYVCTILLRSSSQNRQHGSRTTLNRIYRILDHIHDTNILCRSILLLNLYFDDKIFGQYDLRDLISSNVQGGCDQIPTNTESLDNHTAPSNERDNHNRMMMHHEFTDDTKVFLNRLAKPIYDTMKVRFLHRHRQRAYIEIVIFPEWISLYKEAKIFDLHCNNQQQKWHLGRSTAITNGISELDKATFNYFTQYVLTAQIQFMDRYVELGMEVGLFRNIIHDITFAYWYRDYLLSALHAQLSTKMNQTSQDPHPTTTTAIPNTNDSKQNAGHKEMKTSSKSGNKKKNHHHPKNGKHLQDENRAVSAASACSALPSTNGQMSRSILPNEYEDMYELKVISLKRHLCRKTIQYISLLRKVGIIREQTFEFTSLKRMFMKRFDIFHSMHQPPPLYYEDYVNGIDASAISTFNLIQLVSEGYKACRTMIDEMIGMIIDQDIDAFHVTMAMPELRSLMKVCVGNIVYVQRLLQLLEKKNGNASSAIVTTINAKATFDFDSHNQFCIIKIEEVIE